MLTYTGNECFGAYIAIIYLFMVQNPQRGRFKASPPFPTKGGKNPWFPNKPIAMKWFDFSYRANRKHEKKISILEHTGWGKLIHSPPGQTFWTLITGLSWQCLQDSLSASLSILLLEETLFKEPENTAASFQALPGPEKQQNPWMPPAIESRN